MTNVTTYQISQKVERIRKFAQEPRPQNGWLSAIRNALGITQKQLGHRTGKNYQAIQQMEQGELNGAPTLKTMQELAQAMDCQFVYALIPNKPIEEMIDAQATRKVEAMMRDVAHTMMLEDQALPEADIKAVVFMVKENLKETQDSKIWDDE